MLNYITAAFKMNGGAGNRFIQMNFLYCVKRYIADEPVQMVVYGHTSDEFNKLLMEKAGFINDYYSARESIFGLNNEVFIILEFFPEVVKCNDEIVSGLAPRFYRLLNIWREFMDERARRYGVIHPHTNYGAYIFGINTNHTVINGLDVYDELKIGNKYSWKLEVEENGDLNDFGLIPNSYITLQRGATPMSGNIETPRLWPRLHYENLINLLKEKYPDKVIVQVGESKNSSPLYGVDQNLLDKTSWRTLGVVLKYAWLHIDGDCGMVHYRKALWAGPSVVLFGHTPMEYCGYCDNINIKSNACRHFCARLSDYWLQKCLRGFEPPICMSEISPADVMDRIIQWEESYAD